MSYTCEPSPINKKEYITDIGKILVDDYGKKAFYKPEEVKKAHNKSKWYHGLDFSCWGMSTFSSHSDFDLYHSKIGEDCNYTEMKTEMFQGIANSESLNWLDIPDIDIDSSFFELGDVFSGIFENFGEILASIFE